MGGESPQMSYHVPVPFFWRIADWLVMCLRGFVVAQPFNCFFPKLDRQTAFSV
jgi:hypothetical protein